MKFSGFIRDLLFLAFIGYLAQGTLYASGSALSQSLLILILGISAFYLFKTLFFTTNKDLFYKVWTIFLLLNIFGFFLTANYNDPRHFGMFKGILLGALPFYPFYDFAQNGKLKEKHLLYFFMLLVPITILQFFLNIERILLERVSENEDVVNNMAYGFVFLIPFVFLIKKKNILSIATIAVLMFFTIKGSKRGAVLTGIVGLLSFIYFKFRTTEKRKRIRAYILLIVGILILAYYTYDIYESNEYLISRIQRIGEEGGTSGRNIIYERIFEAWYSSENLFSLLFGFGFASSIKFAGNFAHNDWLELLSNFGVLGVFIYGWLFYAAAINIYDKRWDSNKRLLMLTIVSMWFLVTLVSMGYTSVNTAYLRAVLFGYLLGEKQRVLTLQYK